MKEVSVQEILDQYSLIVPEIQREYVWGFNQYAVFETFLSDIKEGFQSKGDESPEIQALQDTINNPHLDAKTKENLLGVLEKMRSPTPSVNIGFLYSYKPGYYIGNDREEDLYLIDGQQRFTTLFLILFYFSLKENRKAEFIELFKFDAAKEKIAFDYRVRSITHQFMIDLTSKSQTVEDLLCVREKRWFLTNYATDTTVKSIAGTDNRTGVFNLLNQSFKDSAQKYYDFVKGNIKFWHFKTEETSQGEELYITMNSRGQQLADNETIRAKLFDNEDVKKSPLTWSEQWELWQNFFWQHRDKESEGVTADEGFNEFLRWVQLLKFWEVNLKLTPASGENAKTFEKYLQWESGSQLDVNLLSLEDIKLTFEALDYLYEDFKTNQIQFKAIYPKSYNDRLLPSEWISTNGTSLEIINLFQLLPILLFCKKSLKQTNTIDVQSLYRLVRTIKTLSKDTTIGKAVRNQIANVLSFSDMLSPAQDLITLRYDKEVSKTILNEELSAKMEILATTNERHRLEDLIWFAEDIGLNNGEILHLIGLTKTMQPANGPLDVDVFEKVQNAYAELMKHQIDVNGNILHTDCYLNSFDRIEKRSSWYKQSGLLNLVRARVLSPVQPLKDFLIDEQRKFIRQYKTVEEISNEDYTGNQLYVYYILSNNPILEQSPGWSWDNCFNFGKSSQWGDLITLFTDGRIFQSYRSAFHYNYDRILKIHRLQNAEGIFESLMNWASK